MKALGKDDPNERTALIEEAAKQSGEAKDLYYNQLNIVMDFGEIARLSDPELALTFHEYGRGILNDPARYELGDNPFPLVHKLLMRDGEINIATEEQKLSWITYQIALDHLAMDRKVADEKHKAEHDRLFEEAKELDKNEIIQYIYTDQLTILNLFLPDPRHAG